MASDVDDASPMTAAMGESHGQSEHDAIGADADEARLWLPAGLWPRWSALWRDADDADEV